MSTLQLPEIPLLPPEELLSCPIWKIGDNSFAKLLRRYEERERVLESTTQELEFGRRLRTSSSVDVTYVPTAAMPALPLFASTTISTSKAGGGTI